MIFLFVSAFFFLIITVHFTTIALNNSLILAKNDENQVILTQKSANFTF